MWLYGELSIPLDIKAEQQPSIYEGDILYWFVGAFSTSFKTKVAGLLKGDTISGFTPYLALFNGDPEDAGGELSGGAYARQAMVFSAPSEQTGGQMMIQNSDPIKFPSPTNEWGNWAYTGMRNAETGGDLILKAVNPNPEVLKKNYVPSVDVNKFRVMMN